MTDDVLLAELVCPRDRGRLEPEGETLVCVEGHTYPVVDGIPVLLLDDEPPTHYVCADSIALAGRGGPDASGVAEGGIHPFVQKMVAATNGRLYVPLIGKLTRYPIPEFPLGPPRPGAKLLEVGCHWGRWCVAAARAGYVPFGIDPSLEGIAAARHVARQLGVEAHYVVGDGRHLPFRAAAFDVVFSYSVLQHFRKHDVLATLDETQRVLGQDGTSLIQMANAVSVRGVARERRFREQREEFQVRYWTVPELRREFRRHIGPSETSVDAFFSLNAQPADLPLLPPRYRQVVRASTALRALSQRVPPLVHVADSVWIRSRRSG